MDNPKAPDKLLKTRFEPKHVDAALKHFRAMVEEFQRSEWEESIAKGGKFIEAVLKALWVHVGNKVPPPREFKAGKIIIELEKCPQSSFEDTGRLTIPRACRFAYDIASNRGARHDPDEVDPNEMDANAVIATCSWILAEMLRYSQKGAIDLNRVKELLSSLVQRRYPVIEEVDGRVYFHLKKKSAKDIALLTLWHKHPERISKDEITQTVTRHRFTKHNASMAVSRLTDLVDDDGSGNLKLLAPGLRQAEQIIASRNAYQLAY